MTVPPPADGGRVVSLLPAATEIVVALGGGALLVGVSHECNYPAELTQTLPRVTRSRIGVETHTAAELDHRIRDAVHRGDSLFQLDEQQIVALHPTLLLTQALYDVCAISEDDVRAVAARMTPPPAVVTLSGMTIEGIFTDVRRVAQALEIASEGEELVAGLRVRLRVVDDTVRHAAAPRPRVAVIESIHPVYVAGHWVPEMVRHAGGTDVRAIPGTHASTMTPEQIRGMSPDVILIAPYGYDVERAAAAAGSVLTHDAWHWARALPVWALDANALTSRPGPRVVDGVETMAAVLHPALFAAPSTTLARPVTR